MTRQENLEEYIDHWKKPEFFYKALCLRPLNPNDPYALFCPPLYLGALKDVEALVSGGADGCVVQTIDQVYPVGPEVEASIISDGRSIGDIVSYVACPAEYDECDPEDLPEGTVYTYVHTIRPGVDAPNDPPFTRPVGLDEVLAALQDRYSVPFQTYFAQIQAHADLVIDGQVTLIQKVYTYTVLFVAHEGTIVFFGVVGATIWAWARGGNDLARALTVLIWVPMLFFI